MELYDLQSTAHELSQFVVSLTRGLATIEDLRIQRQPVQWRDEAAGWERLFSSAGHLSRQIRGAYDSLLGRTWESQGAQCSASAYEAVEDWLRTHTFTTKYFRPLMTTKPLWLAAAAHNWIWLCRYPDRTASSSVEGRCEGSSLEQKMTWYVDPFLDQMASTVSGDEPHRYEVGDLVTMHLVAVNLGRLAKPLLGRLSSAQHNRLERLQTLCALPRLVGMIDANTGSAQADQQDENGHAEKEAWWSRILDEAACLPHSENESWIGIDTLLMREEAAGLRQCLSSSFGRCAMQDDASTVAVLKMLDTLNELADARKPPGYLREGVRTFVAHVLRATLSESPAEAWPQVWTRWFHGYPQRTTLAQWSGRLACWCEARVQTRRHVTPPEMEWLWRELARTTLPKWMASRERASPKWIASRDTGILCWGLWIDGYLHEAAQVPRLVLTRNACRQSLDQLVSSWRTSVNRAVRRADSLNEPMSVRAKLERLKDDLEATPAFSAMLRDEPQGLAPPEGEQPAQQKPKPALDQRPVNPLVKAYRH